VDVSFATCPGSVTRSNEDFVTASPSVAVVLDGLSAPPALGIGCLHGTPWFVTQLGVQLVSAATTARDEPLQDLVAGAISRVADSHAHTCDLEHPGTPSSSLAILREHAQRVEYLLLFDSVIVLDGPSGLSVISDRRVDAFAREEDLATRGYPIGSPTHQHRVQELVAAQRRHRNQPDGYWVAGAKPEAAYQAVTGSWPHDRLSRAALLSDGVSCLVELYSVVDWTELLDLLQQHGPRHAISRVREVEDTDPTDNRWPRYKRSDDATVAFAYLARVTR
jgi:sulfur transfer complex TusBCD TusB component (DsrH family)